MNYTDNNDPNSSSSGNGTLGRESPRLESPDSLPPTALLFKDAVEAVSEEVGVTPWTYVLSIINEKSVADQDIMAKAMSLINKVCV